jgi:predicted small secreted protein
MYDIARTGNRTDFTITLLLNPLCSVMANPHGMPMHDPSRKYQNYMENAMNNKNRTAAGLFLVLLLTLMTSACHTMAGIGKDTQEVGEEIKETAEGN